MPEKRTLERARRDKRAGKAASTQAGEFVREEMEHIRSKKHGARSTKQAIAIGLSKARRAGVDLPPPGREASSRTRYSAKKAYEAGQHDDHRPTSSRRSKATLGALKREGHSAASKSALARQAHAAAGRRSAASRSDAARRGARVRLEHRTHAERSRVARKAARTRAGSRVPESGVR